MSFYKQSNPCNVYFLRISQQL